jgi:hypothetical protein
VTVAFTCTGALAVAYPAAEAVMLALPIFTPFTWVDAVVCPAGTVTLGAPSVTFVVSLLTRFTVTADGGADGRVTVKVALPPNCTAVLAGSPIEPPLCTVTLVVVLGRFGAVVLAVIVTGPPSATPVTGTFTVLVPAAITTLAGTVATAVLPEVRLIVIPPVGALADRFSATFCVTNPLIVTVGEPNVIVAATVTGALAVV